MLAACPSQGDTVALDGNPGEKESYIFLACGTSSQDYSLCHAELGRKKQATAQVLQTLAVITEIQQVFLNKYLFICCMPLGQFPDILTDYFLKTILINDCCFAEEVYRTPNTTIPEVDPDKIYT